MVPAPPPIQLSYKEYARDKAMWEEANRRSEAYERKYSTRLRRLWQQFRVRLRNQGPLVRVHRQRDGLHVHAHHAYEQCARGEACVVFHNVSGDDLLPILLHEVMHHVLFKIEGWKATSAWDDLVPDAGANWRFFAPYVAELEAEAGALDVCRQHQ